MESSLMRILKREGKIIAAIVLFLALIGAYYFTPESYKNKYNQISELREGDKIVMISAKFEGDRVKYKIEPYELDPMGKMERSLNAKYHVVSDSMDTTVTEKLVDQGFPEIKYLPKFYGQKFTRYKNIPDSMKNPEKINNSDLYIDFIAIAETEFMIYVMNEVEIDSGNGLLYQIASGIPLEILADEQIDLFKVEEFLKNYTK